MRINLSLSGLIFLAVLLLFSCTEDTSMSAADSTESSRSLKKGKPTNPGKHCTTKTYYLEVIINGVTASEHYFDNCEENEAITVSASAAPGNTNPVIDISSLVANPECDKTVSKGMSIKDDGNGYATATHYFGVNKDKYRIDFVGTWTGTWKSHVIITVMSYTIGKDGKHDNDCLITNPVDLTGTGTYINVDVI